ncbi:MAG: hypothetical protein ABJN36_08620 [Cyclobacteriaceae bacterium]
MKILLFITYLFSNLFAPPESVVHTNVVGELRLDNFKNEVFLEAILDKRYLTVALKNEGDCTPDEMLTVCGSKYLMEHTNIAVNEAEVEPIQQSVEVQRDFVVFKYSLGDQGTINQVTLQSDYMTDYFDHSEINVSVEIYQLSRTYRITEERSSVTINL